MNLVVHRNTDGCSMPLFADIFHACHRIGLNWKSHLLSLNGRISIICTLCFTAIRNAPSRP
jgi:hypothetical protein